MIQVVQKQHILGFKYKQHPSCGRFVGLYQQLACIVKIWLARHHQDYFPYGPCMEYLPTFTYIYHKFMPNVGKYSMHGASGFVNHPNSFRESSQLQGVPSFPIPPPPFVVLNKNTLHHPQLEAIPTNCNSTLPVQKSTSHHSSVLFHRFSLSRSFASR